MLKASISKSLLKVVNNSSSFNKGCHDRGGVSISHLSYKKFLRFLGFSIFFLVLFSTEKIYQTVKAVFWKCGKTRVSAFDKLPEIQV